jgi:hypothetical protein
MPVIIIVWKSWNTAAWNACGMCLIRTPGMWSGPRGFVAQEESESFVKNGEGKFAYDHVSGRGRGG